MTNQRINDEWQELEDALREIGSDGAEIDKVRTFFFAGACAAVTIVNKAFPNEPEDPAHRKILRDLVDDLSARMEQIKRARIAGS